MGSLNDLVESLSDFYPVHQFEESYTGNGRQYSIMFKIKEDNYVYASFLLDKADDHPDWVKLADQKIRDSVNKYLKSQNEV